MLKSIFVNPKILNLSYKISIFTFTCFRRKDTTTYSGFSGHIFQAFVFTNGKGSLRKLTIEKEWGFTSSSSFFIGAGNEKWHQDFQIYYYYTRVGIVVSCPKYQRHFLPKWRFIWANSTPSNFRVLLYDFQKKLPT